MTEKLGCPICSEPLDVPATGRPPRYCGEPCRRWAEAERARLGRFVSWLERELVKAKCAAADASAKSLLRDPEAVSPRVAVLTDELTKARTRYVNG